MLFDSTQQQKFIVEITVISAEGLKSTSSCLFSHRLRPFVSISTVPPAPASCHRGNHGQVYQTRVDDSGGVNPRWGDSFRVPVDASFFANRYSCIYLQLYTKRLFSGKAQLGWCQIPVCDIGFPPAGSLRHLSYRLRDKDGSRGRGIVNISVELENAAPFAGNGLRLGTCQTVIGIPVTALSRLGLGLAKLGSQKPDANYRGVIRWRGDPAI